MGLAVFFITGTHMFGYPSGQIVAACTTVIVTAKRDQKAFDCFAPLLERLDESWRIHYWYCMILYCIEAMFSQLRRVSKVFHNFFIWQLFESSWRLRYWRTDIIFAFTTCKISLGWLLAGRFWHFCSVHRASWQTALLLRASHPWSADSLGYCCPSSTLLREPPDSKHFEMPLLYFHFMLILKLSWGNFLIRDLDGKSAVAQTDRVPFGLKCFTPVLKDIRKIWSNVSHSMSLLAWKCVQPSVAYRTTWSMSEKSELICSQGDSFFGKSLTASDGSKWLCNEANGLFLPLVHPETKKQMFEEQCWECVFKGTVKGRKTPEISDVSETMVKSGTTISALCVPQHPGWLLEAENKLYYPMNHPDTAAIPLQGQDIQSNRCGKCRQCQWSGERWRHSQGWWPYMSAGCRGIESVHSFGWLYHVLCDSCQQPRRFQAQKVGQHCVRRGFVHFLSCFVVPSPGL